MQGFLFDLPYAPDAPQTLFGAIAHTPYALFFDSARTGDALGRYSFIAAHPDEIIETRGTKTTVTDSQGRPVAHAGGPSDDPFHILRTRIAAHAAHHPRPSGYDMPFYGGAAGLFGYDLGRRLEKRASKAVDDLTFPDMAIGLYTTVLGFDHQQQTSQAVIFAATKAEAETRLETLTNGDRRTPTPVTPVIWSEDRTRPAYTTDVQHVIDHIHAGDIFQANLTRRFQTHRTQDFCAFNHYIALRDASPAPFACFFQLGRVQIGSASPERFLTVRDGQVETRPIKGTAPRHSDPSRDDAAAQSLLHSEKDRAENAMIVDLLRNDLAKSCTDDSIAVAALNRLETYSNVHHLVSVVTGTLRGDCGPVDLLRGCFPGGSITGAPKPRAMDIIETYEPYRRGPYCGAMGYISYDGTMDTNILIRTVLYDTDKIVFNVGGGIVSDSTPDGEYEETLHKASGILASFQGFGAAPVSSDKDTAHTAAHKGPPRKARAS